MNTWKVDFATNVDAQLKADFASGAITRDDIQVIKRWVNEVESEGLEYAQANKDWRDHELTRAPWVGCRAISFSHAGRVIYRVENGQVVVKVLKVTADHDYK